MRTITLHEFGFLVEESVSQAPPDGAQAVPESEFRWLEALCLRESARDRPVWIRLTQRLGRRAIQFTSHVGVVETPGGLCIEILPKVGKAMNGVAEARRVLLDMLGCLDGFRHIEAGPAHLLAARLPIPEVFLAEFLRAVGHVVRRGVRGDYGSCVDVLPALRGKLLVSHQVRQAARLAGRFWTEHDKFSPDRPENRVLHAALRLALARARSWDVQQLARELLFVFSGIAVPRDVASDLRRLAPDRNLAHYGPALDWARLLFRDESPVAEGGDLAAPSLLFPMESLFEAYVASHLARQVAPRGTVSSQVRGSHLVRHQGSHWFRLRPDLLVREGGSATWVLDTKWKLIDGTKANGTDKYGLSQADFYQMQAYGAAHLGGCGNVGLIFPRTERFSGPLEPFEFLANPGLRLWVLPFCLCSRRVLFPEMPATTGPTPPHAGLTSRPV